MTTPPPAIVKMPKRPTHDSIHAVVEYHATRADHHASVEAALMPYVRHDRECYAPHEPCCCGLDDLLTAIEESKK